MSNVRLSIQLVGSKNASLNLSAEARKSTVNIPRDSSQVGNLFFEILFLLIDSVFVDCLVCTSIG